MRTHAGLRMKGTTRSHHRFPVILAICLTGLVLVTGCGSGGNSTSTTAQSTTSPTAPAAVTSPVAKASCGSSTSSAGASEAASTAAGDIPDNQQFLPFKNRSGGYSISYPEGWARSGSGNSVLFQDKGNTITIKVVPGPAADTCLGHCGAQAGGRERIPASLPARPRSTTVWSQPGGQGDLHDAGTEEPGHAAASRRSASIATSTSRAASSPPSTLRLLSASTMWTPTG